jgi:hypothetical protein
MIRTSICGAFAFALAFSVSGTQLTAVSITNSAEKNAVNLGGDKEALRDQFQENGALVGGSLVNLADDVAAQLTAKRWCSKCVIVIRPPVCQPIGIPGGGFVSLRPPICR